MTKIITVTNQKGGVGKTTTSMNLAAGLGKKGKRVLLIDLDPQANSTTGLGIELHSVKKGVFELIVDKLPIKEVILKTNAENVDIIPATIQLAGADLHLSMNKEQESKIFEKPIKEIKKEYDFIIMDCPPSLGIINRNGLSIADKVLIPMQAEYYALEGLTQLLSTIMVVKKMFNPSLQIGGLLITMYDSRTNLGQEVISEVNKFFKGQVMKTKIPRSIKLAEAPSSGRSIFDYAASSTGAKAYEELTKEVLKWGDK